MSLMVYVAAFRLALMRELTYRANFLFGKLRAITFFAVLLFLFSLFSESSFLYSHEELMTYVALGGAFYMIMFVYAMSDIANEIVDGDLINYLLRPVHYFTYWFSRMCAQRLLNGIAAVICFVALFTLLHVPFLIQNNARALVAFTLLSFGSLTIITLIDFLAGCLSFWTFRSFGPRWLVMIGIQFLSGAYAPIDLFPQWIQTIYGATPFPSIAFVPISAYLGRIDGAAVFSALGTQVLWIVLLGCLLFILWRIGVRSYDAIGR